MRETPRARQAWVDYLALGSGRSLDKLAEHLCATHPEYSKSTAKTLSRLLARWSVVHGWQARLDAVAAQEQAAIVARGIMDKQNRLDAANDRWLRMRQVISERAAQHADIEDIPSPAAGASSGLMVLTVRFLPSGGRVEEWAVDTGLLKEMREHEKQAAVEMGQWAERKELLGPGGGPIQTENLSALSVSDLVMLIEAAKGGGGPGTEAPGADSGSDD